MILRISEFSMKMNFYFSFYYNQKDNQNMCMDHECICCCMSGIDADMQSDCGE